MKRDSKKPSHPENERQRLAALKRYEILDTAAEGFFDGVTAMASQICQTPMAMISFIDANRQWFKSKVGNEFKDVSQTPREIAFCAHAILEPRLMEIPDASQDKRFKNSPLVLQGPKIMFYAGVPLVTPEGLAIGTLCVADKIPRRLQGAQAAQLEVLGKQLIDHLEIGFQRRHHERRSRQLDRYSSFFERLNRLASEKPLDLASLIAGHLEAGADLLNIENAAAIRIRDGEIQKDRLGIRSKTAASPQEVELLAEFVVKNCSDSEDPFVFNKVESGPELGPKAKVLIGAPWSVNGSRAGVLFFWSEESNFCEVLKEDSQLVRVLAESLGHRLELVKSHTAMADAIVRLETEASSARLSEKARTEFLSNISHELRTPLNAIVGMTQLLSDDERVSDLVKKDISIIDRAGRELLGKINDILEVARAESGPLQIEKVPFSPTSILGALPHDFSDQLRAKSIGIKIDFEPNLYGEFVGDVVKLRRILAHLVTNAIKFTDYGFVMVQAGLTDAGELEIAVSDTGIGIADERKSELFLPFYQVDGSQSRRFGGVGLGLTICRKLVNFMGGRIEVESKEGYGTTVRVMLPIMPKSEKSDLGARSTSVGGKILIVDDVEENRILIERFLSGLGQKIVMAKNGKEAIELFKGQDFSLVLMDLQMPEMDGPSALRAIRKIESEKGLDRTPVLAVTAHGFDIAGQDDRETGFQALVQKPLKKTLLIEAIRTWLKKKPMSKTA